MFESIKKHLVDAKTTFMQGYKEGEVTTLKALANKCDQRAEYYTVKAQTYRARAQTKEEELKEIKRAHLQVVVTPVVAEG